MATGSTGLHSTLHMRVGMLGSYPLGFLKNVGGGIILIQSDAPGLGGGRGMEHLLLPVYGNEYTGVV